MDLLKLRAAISPQLPIPGPSLVLEMPLVRIRVAAVMLVLLRRILLLMTAVVAAPTPVTTIRRRIHVLLLILSILELLVVRVVVFHEIRVLFGASLVLGRVLLLLESSQ